MAYIISAGNYVMSRFPYDTFPRLTYWNWSKRGANMRYGYWDSKRETDIVKEYIYQWAVTNNLPSDAVEWDLCAELMSNEHPTDLIDPTFRESEIYTIVDTRHPFNTSFYAKITD